MIEDEFPPEPQTVVKLESAQPHIFPLETKITIGERGGRNLCVPVEKSPVPKKASRLYLVGPVPNQIPIGATRTITATLLSPSGGLPNAAVVFTKLTGKFKILHESTTSDPSRAIVDTDASGRAAISILSEQTGPALIQVSVPGTSLSAISFFFGR